ncbi:unnamed protein product [Pseudo-nitzschia multistriata]|uniref:Sulfotransferase domain-containing protein n=1 Tax=Pseudo-nitzschia multistriata TaxID=183589 RepID=A0A448ZLP9_9STRA|nr:unnamed protein product [Pseudo-nitzschia multistriata]
MAAISRHGRPGSKKVWCLSPINLLICFMLVMGLVYVQVSVWMLSGSFSPKSSNSNSGHSPNEVHQRRVKDAEELTNSRQHEHVQKQKQQQTLLKQHYSDWRKYAVELAGKFPEDIIQILRTEDPFGVRTFEKRLLETESSQGRFLTLEELKGLFPCPGNEGERITLPDQRNHDKAQAFRNGTEPYFLFFQHLRKAGGTNFCTLATKNFEKKNLPKYYCMPDYHWDMTPPRGAGYLTRYKNSEIIQHMKENQHKIAGNEWDPFDHSRFFDLPAAFATSFRRPLDRALSQFRFECIENRGCKIKNVTKWWNKRRDLTDVYTWTFSNDGIRKMFIGHDKESSEKRQELLGTALDTVAKFNLVMVMEWLAYAPQHVKDVLGFQNTATLTERVRPHIGQAKRHDGQEHNSLGAAGIAKASWTPEDYLPPDLYEIMSRDLALDEILTDAARRIFLERLVCSDVHRFD